MPPLLQKLRRRSDRASSRSKTASPAKHLRRDWLYWTCVLVSAAVALSGYFGVTSARLLKEPPQLDYGPQDPRFATELGPVLGAEFTGGNAIQTLVNGAAFFPAMLDAIRHAEKTITLETYIWTPGRIGNEFVAALSERARHGVKVNVLIDGMGTLKFHGEERTALEQAGVRVVKYGREHWYEVKPNINHRTHRKLLVVDGRIGFTGGMCIDDHWLGNADTPTVWRDTVVRVEGPVVREMQGVFTSNWLQTTSELLLGDGYFPPVPRAGVSLAQCFKSGPGEGPQNTRLAYFFAIAAARRTIDISNAYFVPDDLAIELLLQARQRGVKIRVIVPAESDSVFGRAASRSRWGKLLEAGVEFYQYRGALFHCKSMVVDGALVILGSANFDNRSFSINDEVGLDILDPAIASEHERIFQSDLAHAPALDPRTFASRPWWIKVADDFCGMFRSQF